MQLFPYLLALLLTTTQSRLLQDTSLTLSEIVWSPEQTKIYIGSPSILRLPNGNLAASADRFGGPHQDNCSIFISNDDGVEWKLQTWVVGQHFSNLFTVNQTVYLLGTDKKTVRIARSDDNGVTWRNASILTAPAPVGFASGAMPTLHAQGRYWRTMEHVLPHHPWPLGFQAMVLSAPDTCADLLEPSCWTASPALPFNNSWIPNGWRGLEGPGYLEGNMVEGPDGTIYNILRFNVRPAVLGNYAIALKYDLKANALSFDRVFGLPGGHSKFCIHRDPVTKLYLTFSSWNNNILYVDQRNILVMAASEDLFNWHIIETVLQDDTGFDELTSIAYTGFHYVDWKFDGEESEDVIMAIRTSYRGAESYHNSNRMTFKNITQWRSLLGRLSNLTTGTNSMILPAFSPAQSAYTVYVPSIPYTLNMTLDYVFTNNYTINGKAVRNNDTLQISIATNNTVLKLDSADTNHHYTLNVITITYADISLSGHNYTLARFCNGCLAFTNRDYKLAQVSPLLASGFNFTKLAGGLVNETSITIHVNSPGYVVVLVDKTSTVWAYESLGWESVSELNVHYTSPAFATLTTLVKWCDAGEVVHTQQTGFAGMMALVPLESS